MTGGNFNFKFENMSGTGNIFGPHGHIENHVAAAEPAPQAQLLALLADLDRRIAANAPALPNASELTGTVAEARREIEAGPAQRHRLMSVRSMLAAIVAGAAGVKEVTDAVQHIMRLLGAIEAP